MTEAQGFGLGGQPNVADDSRRVWSVSDSSAARVLGIPDAATGSPAVPAYPVPAPLAGAYDELSVAHPHLAPPPPVGQPIAAAPPAGPASYPAPPGGALAPAAAPLGRPLDAPPPSSASVLMAGIHPLLIGALDDLVARGGSDLHIAAGSPPMLRIDGELTTVTAAAMWDAATVHTVLDTILNERQRTTLEVEWELDFAISPRGDNRFRVNCFRDRGARAAAFRLIPTEIKSLKQLGVPGVVSKFAQLPRGLVLVTGPTGSGKSTTLAALIDLVNKSRADHIVTIEDPIEFVHPNQRSLVNQREVGADTHSFSDALKRVLRQDPDVILIGELRDLETVSTALTAAETGHLVFATLHTQSAAQTIDRIIDVFPPHQQGQVRAQLALTLQGVVCQTLLPRAVGSGRIIATEIMMTTSAIANLIREGKTYQITSSLQAGREQGMHTMDQHLADLVNSHMVTHEAAMLKMQDPENFHRLVHREVPMAAGAVTGTRAFGSNFGGAS